MYENHHLLRYFWNRMIENHAKVSILLPLLALFQFLDCRTKKSQKTIYIYLYYIYIYIFVLYPNIRVRPALSPIWVLPLLKFTVLFRLCLYFLDNIDISKLFPLKKLIVLYIIISIYLFFFY